MDNSCFWFPWYPEDPWDWYIYLHLVDFFLMGNVGKYTIHGSSGIYNHPIGKECKWYISGIFPANWVIIYHRSHLSREPETPLVKIPGDGFPWDGPGLVYLPRIHEFSWFLWSIRWVNIQSSHGSYGNGLWYVCVVSSFHWTHWLHGCRDSHWCGVTHPPSNNRTLEKSCKEMREINTSLATLWI